jgi:hypothetical protein
MALTRKTVEPVVVELQVRRPPARLSAGYSAKSKNIGAVSELRHYAYGITQIPER